MLVSFVLLCFTIVVGPVCCAEGSSSKLSSPQWLQIGPTITGSAEEFFGFSLSTSADGGRMVVSMPARDSPGGGEDTGRVQLFEFDTLESAWLQVGSSLVGEAAKEISGYAVSLSESGTHLAIGSPSTNGTGLVRVFKYDKTVWTQLGSDIMGDMFGDRSGHSVSLSSDGGRLAVGTPHGNTSAPEAGLVRVYEFISSVWVQLGEDLEGEAAGDESGWSVSLSASGNRLAIGARSNGGAGDDAGHVRVYDYNNSLWTQLGQDIDGEAAGDRCGSAVALSTDGHRVVIGAYQNDGAGDNAGHVRVFEHGVSGWTQLGADIDGQAAGEHSGEAVAISSSGERVAVVASFGAASTSGKVRMYDLDAASATWKQTGDTISGTANSSVTGAAVSMSADGSIVAVGSFFGAGQASVWQLLDSPTLVPSGSPTSSPTVYLTEDDIGLCNLAYHTSIGSLLMTETAWTCNDA